MTTAQPEQRSLSPRMAQTRAERRADDGPRIISGYAAVFYREGDPSTEYPIFTDLVERIMPGAFDNAIRENDDVRSFLSHSKMHLLGRRSAGTLALSVDNVGLRYEVTLPDTTAGRDAFNLVERGDIDGSSFQFLAIAGLAKRGRIVWAEEVRDGLTVDVREIHDLELFEVGPGVWPAYESTTASAGSRCCSDAAAAHLQQERQKARLSRLLPAPEEVELRARSVEVFCHGLERRGENLGELLSDLIQDKAEEDDRPRAEIVQEMANQAGSPQIEPGTVNQIANGSIKCPPRNRLEGFARVLGVSVDRLIAAAEEDGCEY